MITEINRSNAGLTEIESEYIAKNLLINVPVLSPVHTNEDVVMAFTMHENVIGLPVIENNRPIGLINRNIFMDGMAKPFIVTYLAEKAASPLWTNRH